MTNTMREYTRSALEGTNVSRPGGSLATRALYLNYIADVSGSMINERIAVLNDCFRSLIPSTQEKAAAHPNATVYQQTIAFATKAEIVSPLTKIEDVVWKDLSAGGVTNYAAAFELLNSTLVPMEKDGRMLRPVNILVSDGAPTGDYKAALEELKKNPMFQKGTNIAIAIGCDCSNQALIDFTGNVELVFEATKSDQVVDLIKWASTQISEKPLDEAEVEDSKVKIPLIERLQDLVSANTTPVNTSEVALTEPVDLNDIVEPDADVF